MLNNDNNNNNNEIGLQLNHSKCELVSLHTRKNKFFVDAGWNFKEISREDVCLLGAPLSKFGVDAAISTKREELNVLVRRLKLMPGHDCLFLLKNALAIPKLLYILRT